jgi:hypothetical protein
MGKKKAQNWIEERKAKADAERKAQLKEKGFAEFFKLPVGETTIEVMTDIEPREREGNFGTQCIFRIKVGKDTNDLSVALRSPLYRFLLDNLSKGKTKFTIVRTGEGKSTKYDIKKAW